MSTTTKIEWTDTTGSPWLGCTKVSEGCAHCYLPRQTPLRVLGLKLGQPRHRCTSFRIGVIALNSKAQREGRRIRIFPSLCDWLDPEVPVEWLADFLDTIRLTPALDWQLLTKRPEWWRQRLDAALANGCGSTPNCSRSTVDWILEWIGGRPPENVWIGWTAENQARADERTPHGLKIPARVRFVSVEPMLGPVVLGPRAMAGAGTFRQMEGIHWVICGGESGPGARPMHPDWARSLRDQCAAAHVPFFFKQWGEWAPMPPERCDRVVEHRALITGTAPNRSGAMLWRVGKRPAGRLLDGREHNEFPEVCHA